MRIEKAPPRVLLASPCGHSGKTVIACGVSRILKNRGYNIQTFKKGPDYIDPSWLTAASGRPCRNLDLYLMGEDTLVKHFWYHANGSDFLLIEGNMGLYDGIEEDGAGSTAHIARLIRTPVILIVNTQKMTRSVAALVEGYKNFEPETMVSGVVLNNVSGERHARKLVKAIERHVGIPVVGVIPRERNLLIGERHLGLIPYGEMDKNSVILERVSSFLEKHIDMDTFLQLANQAPNVVWQREDEEKPDVKRSRVRIGVFYDYVFHFYYPENLEALVQEGADLVFINSVTDKRLPNVDGLYIGGGFPEFYLGDLSLNRELMDDIVRFVEDGKPLYAECGGLMYLCDYVYFRGRRFKMAGLVPADVFLTKKPQGHGYVEAEVVRENPFYPVGEKVRGHEFHHSALKLKNRVNFVFKMGRGKGGDGLNDGILYRNMFASYTHIHALGVPYWAERLVSLCMDLKDKNEDTYIMKEVGHG